MARPEKNQKGIALLVVLWIMVLLMALSTEFATAMRTEVRTLGNFKEDIECYYLAKAGINLAMAEILQKAQYHAYNEETGFVFGKAEAKKKKGEVSGTDELPEETETVPVIRKDIALGKGTITYTITDENSKININTATRGMLIKALRASGLELGELRDVIADSILDWIDSDDNHRLNGAETSFYQVQDPPYAAKNDRFDSIEELIRVRGITEEILYGTAVDESGTESEGKTYRGLARFFTVQDVRVFNPNTAGPEMLSIFYSEEALEKILKEKEEKGRIQDTLSTHFKIVSTGKLDNSNTRHTVDAIIEKLGTGDKATLLVRYWNDNALES